MALADEDADPDGAPHQKESEKQNKEWGSQFIGHGMLPREFRWSH
jgi:hypothetical protein